MRTSVALRRIGIAGVLAAAVAAGGACAGRPRPPEGPRRAVVIFEPGRKDDAAAARTLLTDAGWDVWVEPAGPARRSTSSLALYGLAASGPDEATIELLAPLGDVEPLPFPQGGPGGTRAVLWLAGDE